jgi:hypothetical protein
MKFRSAGQLPKTLKTWLLSKGIQGPRVTRIGKKLHMKILTCYKEIWKARCSAIRKRHLLFKDRLKLFPVQKPLHEMTADDYIAFAKNLQNHLNQLASNEKQTAVQKSHTPQKAVESFAVASSKNTKATYIRKGKQIL